MAPLEVIEITKVNGALAGPEWLACAEAHKFYFREGMHIPSFCFRKAINT
ncbi:hypothetical protein [Azonexus sp.]|jgi:hypothetical protein|nr:hypothetical protein [Azonexus sp.]MDR1994295.1 hypothetical protein [Azonexus sp.]